MIGKTTKKKIQINTIIKRIRNTGDNISLENIKNTDVVIREKTVSSENKLSNDSIVVKSITKFINKSPHCLHTLMKQFV